MILVPLAAAQPVAGLRLGSEQSQELRYRQSPVTEMNVVVLETRKII